MSSIRARVNSRLSKEPLMAETGAPLVVQFSPLTHTGGT